MNGYGYGLVLAVLGAAALACSGVPGTQPESPVPGELAALQGTRLEAVPAPLPTFSLEDGGTGTGSVDAGSGVQILHVAPFGVGRQPLQAVVVFDRPMVALSDLDTMTSGVPLTCKPVDGAAIPTKARWAGTSTAVVLPDATDGGTFPPGHAFECVVPAGTKALDGATVEKEVRWSFETARPHLLHASFPGFDGFDSAAYDPEKPIELVFDQPVEPDEIARHLAVNQGGVLVSVKVARPEPDPNLPPGAEQNRIELTGPFEKGTTYELALAAGIVGKGPLPSAEPHSESFSTYPPLTVLEADPAGSSPAVPTESLRLRFSTPVEQAQISKNLTVTPLPDGWEPPDGHWPSQWWSYGVPLNPNTRYTVHVAAELTDSYGQTLGKPYDWSFQTGNYEPWLTSPAGLALYAANNPKQLPFKQLNATRVDATAAPFEPALFTDPEHWREAVRLRLADKSLVKRFDVVLDRGPNRTEIDEVDLSSLLGGKGGFGWVATRFSAPNVVDWRGDPQLYDGLMVVTDLAATMKVETAATELWVTSLSQGLPVDGADVELFDGVASVASGKTDKSGLVRLEGVGRGADRWSQRLWARVSKGADQSLVLESWNDGLQPWAFGMYGGSSQGQQVVAHGFADRGIYRLGDPVYARATFRLASAKGLELTRGEAHWTLTDPSGTEVASGDASLDDRGGVSLQTALPKAGALGDWQVSVLAVGEGWQSSETIAVPVKAYRAPAFRVEVVATPIGVAGQPIQASADARYLFGGVMKEGKVHWRAWTEDASFEPKGYDGWSFSPEVRWWEEERDPLVQLSGDQVAVLTDGRSSFVQKVEKGYRDRPVKLFMEAEVTDVDRQSVANRSTTLVHPATFYVGLNPKVSLPKVGDKVPVQVVALDTAGRTLLQPLDVKVFRRDWNSVRERGMDGQWRWVNTPVDDPVSSQGIKTVADAGADPVEVAFQPSKAGYYVMRAEGRDALGNPVVSEAGMYVLGSGYVGWGRNDSNHLELVPDKRTYQVGQTARILVKSPVERLRALVTVEREGILSRQVVKLDSTASTIEIPLTVEERPNLYVSVVAVEGAGPQDAPDKGAPAVFAGLVELKVQSDSEHLGVAVSPKGSAFHPGDTVEVEVAVQQGGKPLPNAGVTLFAVDEAVLSLTDYHTPDSYETFYAERGLSVTTSDARVAALDRATYLTKGAPRGGGGGEGDASGPEVRSKFVTTVTWQPDLHTDASGVAHARFDLPDNLTTFRIMAVADAGATAFGSGEAQVHVDRPLMLRPALPRLLRTGDLAYAGVVVHNATGAERWVQVSAEVTGPVELVGSPFDVKVPAQGAVEVPFRLKGLEAGSAKFTFRAKSGRDEDALEWPLAVQRDVLLETVATAGRFEGQVTEKLARPDGAAANQGGLRVDLATSALVGAAAGLEYLRDLDCECLEVRTSRALGELMVLRVMGRVSTPLRAEDLKADVLATLSDLHRYQTSSGGLSYWTGDYWPSSAATAYAVEFMGRAKEDGFAVDDALLASSVDYLRNVIAGYREADWAHDDPEVIASAEAYVAVALARAGSGDAGLDSRLFDKRKSLSVFGAASLLEAIVRTTGPDRRTDELAKLIAARSYVDAASASVKENDTGRWWRLWGSDELSTAASLEALVRSGKDDALAPRYALHLASAKVGDRWGNSRATAAVLAALAAYADKYEAAAGGKIGATVTLAAKERLKQDIVVPGTATVDLPMAQVDNGDLVVGATGGPLYYEARLAYAPLQPVPRDEGFTLTRSMELVEGGSNGTITAGAQLRVTLTMVTPTVRHDVTLIDRIPAGFEPVDSSLATASHAPSGEGEGDGEVYPGSDPEWFTPEQPEYGGSDVFDHHEIDDAEVRLYASYVPPGVFTWRYLVRATTPGTYTQPPATVEERYEPEHFGRTGGGAITIAAEPVAVAAAAGP